MYACLSNSWNIIIKSQAKHSIIPYSVRALYLVYQVNLSAVAFFQIYVAFFQIQVQNMPLQFSATGQVVDKISLKMHKI